MSTPEDEIRFAEAFNELGESAELMVEPPTAAAIRSKLRRRRATRVTVAAVAALALLAPASWALQQAATAEERDEPVIAEERTGDPTGGEESAKPQEPTPSTEPSLETETGTSETAPPPSFDDLVGQELELPSFGDSTELACPTGPAQLTAADGEGPVHLIKVVHARLSEDGPQRAVALVGCRPGEAMIRQVLVIEAEGDGYAATEQLHLYDYGATASVYDIAPDADYGVLLGLLEEEPCCSTQIQDLDRWIERYRDGGSQKLTGDVPGVFITDLAVSAEVVASGEGTREVVVTVANLGENDAAQFTLNICSTESIRLQGEDSRDCSEGPAQVETVDGLGAGDSYETTWTIEVDPREEWPESGRAYGQEFIVGVQMPSNLIDALVLETDWENNRAQRLFDYDGTD
ncbi:hypothetical protein O1R50_22555 [Glycomyces luteolus]|uniref:Uncharacterized protein n=1 Tax=Glycomyces luteolus TaxID=2670330 RepID=A0A9X3PFB0_9ACTN|nr:hypothetical protein [Glycomyces luteolus]MDA1362423.1 hypothetical protein [Glycomyces luteolus]